MSRTVLYTSPFVPPEWIAAHRLTPQRVIPSDAAPVVGLPVAGVCPYVRALVSTIQQSDAAAVVMSTTCDQMRHAAELVGQEGATRLFLMNVPHAWQSTAALQIYISELRRLGSFLCELEGARHPSEDSLTAAVGCPTRETPRPIASHQPGVPVALIGGHLIGGVDHASQLIRQAGGHIALDGTEYGQRCVADRIDGRHFTEDPLKTIVSAHFAEIPDPFRRPNTQFFSWLRSQIPASGVKGAVLWRYIWCDTWHAEVQRIREAVCVPLLDLDTAGVPSDASRALSRLEAFVETIG